ncbi:MFS general substrate transporter [Fomitiporia mediterranea MF3/22]|uniref:MFS general substrate transporter n=1 Tax=Fomitiporia mediterranea (strain MF3/22) TaxID=694068 RepID=UPI0004408CB1|nr:MFS general substrate transporter [Fomitiporia mediterranea MF3/22]EJD07107.1 MFS general substrate transporter [Fomitiporia mediterranea MF3/22]
MGESQPLLDSEDRRKECKKPFYRPRPMWIVPFAVLASISRGMTIAPRVEVFTQLACYATYGHPHYNHSTSTLGLSLTPSPLDLSRAGTFDTIFLRTSETNEDGNDDDDTGDEDPLRVPSKRCLSDPAVQSYAARLQTIMTTTMGLLSALTTGWWGHFGERHGRTRVLAAATMGLLLTDVFFVLVSLPRSPLAAHGHKLLVISPILEGLLGGWTTLQSGTSAYISDCTSDGSRAHIFSRFMGVFYFGFALGPMLGAWVITHPPAFLLPLLRFESASEGRTVTPVFWLAVCFSFTNLLLSLFVFPESLGKKKRAAGTDLDPLVIDESEDHREASKNYCGGILSVMKGLFMPLVVFAPKIRPNGRDWNMTLLALAFFGYLLSSGIFQLKYLYAEHVFAWEAEQLSYYITFVGGARAVHLLFVMPFIISCCKPKPKKTSTQQQGTAGNKKPKPTKAQLIAEMKFDLRITQLSYAIDVLSHTLVSLSSTSSTAAAQAAFVGFTVLSSFGSGVVPSMQSLSLCVMQTEAAEDERLGVAKPAGAAATGSLFGALAVLQATGQMILGPLLFGLVYSTTVAQFPKGIFVLAASILAVSLLLLVQVHPLRSAAEMRKQARVRKKYGYPWDGPEVERGRSRVSKDLSGASLPNGSPSRGAATSSSGALVYGSI